MASGSAIDGPPMHKCGGGAQAGEECCAHDEVYGADVGIIRQLNA